MASVDENRKTELLQRMHDLLKLKSTCNEGNFSRRKRLRDNLIDFAEEYLSPEAFEKLLWILKDGGIDLLPMGQLKKGQKRESDDQTSNYEPPAKKKPIPEESFASDINWMRLKITTISQQLADVQNRLKVVESGTIERPELVEMPDPSVFLRKDELKSLLPISSFESFEQINEDVQLDRDFYDRVVLEFHKEYKWHLEKGGWRRVFDRIFGKELAQYYHFMANQTGEIKCPDGIRQPIHSKILVTSILHDAFPEENPDLIEQELRKWFVRCRADYRKLKYRQRQKAKVEAEQVEEIYEGDSQEEEEFIC